MDEQKTSINKPVAVELVKGETYKWCTCDFSQTQPFCDASHKGKTDLKSLHFTAEKDGKAYLCQCKKTKNPPYCDGSHTK